MSRVAEGIPADAKPWVAPAGPSPTAASIVNRLYGVSGEQPHRVVLGGGNGVFAVVVNATTGDEAATEALKGRMGMKVLHVGPATASDATADSSLVLE